MGNKKFYIIFIAFGIFSIFSLQIRKETDQDFSVSVLNYPKSVIATDTRFSEEVFEKEEIIDFNTEYVDDNELELGIEEITQEGKDGKKKIITTVTYYDGEEYERKVEEEIVEPEIDEIIAKGTKIIPKTLNTEYGGITYIRKFSNFWATSYDSTCVGCSTTTATGMKQGYGVVAVDPKVIPLYSRLYIPGYGMAVAGDVGGAVKGNKIDLGYDSLNGQWKAHYVDIYLLAD